MPLTTTRQQLRTQIGLETGWMKQRPGTSELVSGTTSSSGAADGSTIIDSSLYSSAIPQLVRNRSVICITSGASRGQRRYATGPAISTGAVTVSPVFSAQIATSVTYEIWDADGPHPDDVDRKMDKALDEDCWYWRPTPLSLVRGGFIRDAMAVSTNLLDTDGSTVLATPDGTNALSLVSVAFPEQMMRRALRLTSAGSAPWRCAFTALAVDPTHRPDFRFAALIRAAAGMTASLTFRDNTNNVIIATVPATVSHNNTGWAYVTGSFTLPATCTSLVPHLNVSAVTQTADIAFLQLWNPSQTRFECHPTVPTKGHVGQVFSWSGNVYDEWTARPWNGTVERREAMGQGVSVLLSPAPGGTAPWYYEKAAFPGLTTATPVAADDDATTWAPAEWVKAATKYELGEYLAQRDRLNAAARWDEMRTDALRDLLTAQGQYGIERQIIEDRKEPVGVAVRRV